MPYKNPEVKKAKHKEYSAKHYQANRIEVQERNAKTKREKRVEWHAFKSTLKCTNCGFSHPAALDFHHVDRKDKKSVHMLAQNGNYKSAKEEIKKCVVLCANCHRIHHYEERKARKKILKGTKKKSKANP